MSASPSFAPITQAVLANLRSRITRVYDTIVPPDAELPYVFVTPMARTWTPTLANREGLVEVTLQVTCVGATTAGVEDMEFRARQAMAAPLATPGWNVWMIRSEGSTAGVDRDVTPHRLYSTPRWRLSLNPT